MERPLELHRRGRQPHVVQDRADHRLDVAARRPVHRRDRRDLRVRRRSAEQPLEHLRRDERRRARMRDEEVEICSPSLMPAWPSDGEPAGIVTPSTVLAPQSWIAGLNDEHALARSSSNPSARATARRRRSACTAVHAQRVELHHLARVVLVRRAVVARVLVEIRASSTRCARSPEADPGTCPARARESRRAGRRRSR